MAKSTVQENTSRAFFDAVHHFVANKGFDRDDVFSVIEAGLIAAYRKKYKTTENIRVEFDRDKEDVAVIADRIVVDRVVLPGMQIHIDEARMIKPDVQPGEVLSIRESPLEFGRIAAMTALQVVKQRLQTLEQDKIREEYSSKVGELMNGFILRKRNETVYVDLGKVEAIMPVKEQIRGENYRVEDKVKVLLKSIEQEKGGRGIKVIVSRADHKFVQKLFEMEVPEIFDRIVEIRRIGRIPGIRTKVVVASNRSDVDPVGACVGVRGVRIQSIVRELGKERIDIVEYSDDPKEYITSAFSPANPVQVKVDHALREAWVIVPDREYSIAIGTQGSNVRLVSDITGYRINVKSETSYSEEMSTPEARKRLDEIFSQKEEVAETEAPGTPLSDLPGLTSRIIKLLEDGGIRSVEDLIEYNEQDLIGMEGIGAATARKIMQIVADTVEFTEDEG